MDVPCERHGTHKLWDMPKRWVERENIRTREAYCPDDERNTDPILCWTGSSWGPVPGRGVTSAWCRKDGMEVLLDNIETNERKERKGTVVYAVCPKCGSEIAKRNRWKYWEPLYREPE